MYKDECCQSEFGEQFNHDSQAETYDSEVVDETNPIREGYSATLERIATLSRSRERYGDSIICDLGAGTGNLSRKLLGAKKLTCVDLSSRMLDRARAKIRTTSTTTATNFFCGDILSYLAQASTLDVATSSYALHHLTHTERLHMFKKLWDILNPGGMVIFGDLMFLNEEQRELITSRYRDEGRNEMVDDIESEFFWDVELTKYSLEGDGWTTSFEQISKLSWVLIAEREP